MATAARKKRTRKANARRPRRLCMTAGCDNVHYARGLCQTCFQQAHRMIRKGDVTEQTLVKAGLILPAIVRPRGKFSAAVARRLGNGSK